MIDDDIDDCDGERLQDINFTALRTKYQEHHGRVNDDNRIGIEICIKNDPRIFFGYVDLKKKRVGYPSVMSFEDRSASGSLGICDLFHMVSVESRAESCE
jgi:hypothetical protein